MSAHASNGLWARLYPRAWRARYGPELTELITEARAAGARPWRVGVDVAKAAGAEHLRAAELSADAPPPARARGGVLLVLEAWALFVLAGTAVAKSAEHWQDWVPPARRRVPAVAFDVLVATSVVAGLLVLAAAALAVPALLRALPGAWPALRRPLVGAGMLSVTALGATAGLVGWAHQLDPADRNGGNPGYVVGFLAWAGFGAVVLGAWTRVAVVAARCVPLPPRVLRAQARVGAVVAAAMVAMTAATLTWRAALATGPTLVPLAATLVMAAATVLAAVGARRAVRALPAGSGRSAVTVL